MFSSCFLSKKAEICLKSVCRLYTKYLNTLGEVVKDKVSKAGGRSVSSTSVAGISYIFSCRTMRDLTIPKII